VKRSLYTAVMGVHPHNTVFSYNFHNVRHITSFLQSVASSLPFGNLNILDVGGGTSPYLDIFRDKTSRYVVVDVDLQAHPTAWPVRGLAEALPFVSEQFDIVLSNQVLEHVRDERVAVLEAFRVLRPGGLFVGSVPHFSPIHLEPHDYRRLTSLGLENLLLSAGFTDIAIEGNGGVGRALALSLLMDLYLSPYDKGKPQQFDTRKHLALFPLNGLVNVAGIVWDSISGDRKRSPSNYCWRSTKPK
jgi:SAM-dependent methyltransferase